MVVKMTMHLPYLLLKRSQNQSKSRRTKQARKENSQSQHLLTKWKVSWRNFFKFSKSPRDDSWSMKNEVNKKPSKKRKDDGWKQNRTRNEKTFSCVFYRQLHKAPVAAKIMFPLTSNSFYSVVFSLNQQLH